MKKFLFWAIAIIVTLATAIYQRVTGPTYPFQSKVTIGNSEIKYKLERSHESKEDCEIRILVKDPNITGSVTYKRFKTDDPWTNILLSREGDNLIARLPQQPPAGKLAYKVILAYQEKEITLTGDSPLVIRFRGSVPAAVLIPHIIIMFLAMLMSTRAGLEALDPRRNPRKYALWATGLLFVGGVIFGPIVQKFSFGAFWTGFPFGFDLTDNKTLIALIGWIIAVIAGRRGKRARGWIIGAAILLLVVYLIPHSLLGSELDYSKLTKTIP